MAEINQRVGGPYGDIFIVKTPQLDRLGQQFYQQDLMKERQRQQESKLSDDMFSKELAGVRNADINDVVKKYNDYKQAKIGLYKLGSKATPQQQQETLQKKADYYRTVTASKEEKANTLEAAKQVIAKPDDYDENAHQTLRDRMNISVSKMKQTIPPLYALGGTQPVTIDQTNVWDTIKSPDDNNSYVKEVEKAKGISTLRGNPIDAVSPDKLTTTITQYKAPNSATEYINVLTGMGDRKLKKLANKFQYSDDEANDIKQRYETFMQTPEAKAAYPNEPSKIDDSMFMTSKGKALATMAMEHVLLHPPTAIVSKPYNNTGALMDRKLAEKLAFNKLTFGQSMAKIAANKSAGVDPNIGYLSDNVADEVGKPVTVRLKNTNAPVEKTVVYVGDVDPVRLDIITGKDLSKKKIGVKPDEIKVLQPDGTYKVRMGYYIDPGTGDWEGADGQKISRERVKDDYIKQVSPTKFKMQTGTQAVESKVGSHKVVEAKGKTGKKIYIPQ